MYIWPKFKQFWRLLARSLQDSSFVALPSVCYILRDAPLIRKGVKNILIFSMEIGKTLG